MLLFAASGKPVRLTTSPTLYPFVMKEPDAATIVFVVVVTDVKSVCEPESARSWCTA
jgi:hypothetical protein